MLGTLSGIVVVLVTPLFGWLADRFSRRAIFTGVGAIFLVTTIPAYLLIGGKGIVIAALGVIVLAIPAAGWSAVAASAIPEQFTAIGRYSGMAISYNVATALFGVVAPFAATLLVQKTGTNLAPAYYATFFTVAVAIPAIILLREVGRRTMKDIDHGVDLEEKRKEKELVAVGG